MNQLVNISRRFGGDEEGVIDRPLRPQPLPDEFGDEPFVKESGYLNLPKSVIRAINRGEIHYLAIELYPPDCDEIWANPEEAVYRFSDSRFDWRGLKYQDRIESIPELSKFIGRTFNTLTFHMPNVQRGALSGSAFALNRLVRGMRVAVRIIFPEYDAVNKTRLIWWGRLANVADINEDKIAINCSQEIGNFNYEVAKDKFGQACPLYFARGACLGNETFEQKSLAYQEAYNLYGQGGCDRTIGRCKALSNERFNQGQRVVTVNGQFFKEERIKTRFLFFFSRTKINRIPVQFSSKNQSDNDNTVIPIVLGRARVELRPFTWADTGTKIDALLAGCKGRMEGFYNITCHNEELTIESATQHLGELGGVGTQQPDTRFPDSGHNSELGYIGATFSGSEVDDEEDVPKTSSVVKGRLIPVPDGFGGFKEEWSCNPVWITRFLCTNFPYTVVKPEWFDDKANERTADYCSTVIEDDTGAEIPVITASAHTDFQEGRWQRFRSTARFDARSLDSYENNAERQSEALARRDPLNFSVQPDHLGLRLPQPIINEEPDIAWGDAFVGVVQQINRNYLALRYTTNGVINDTGKLSDLLFSLILPTFRGFLRFNHFGQIEIDCRKPADSTFVRLNTEAGESELPVVNVRKFYPRSGYLLIGVGKGTSEIAKVKGIRYANGNALSVVAFTSEGGTMGVSAPTAFSFTTDSPAEVILSFSGTPQTGEKLLLRISEPTGEVYSWDYYLDEGITTAEQAAIMFQTRLNASPSFKETYSAEIFEGDLSRIRVRSHTGYLMLESSIQNEHLMGEEIIRVVEVYEDGKDDVYQQGSRDNMKDFVLNTGNNETYHGVKSVYISAVQDFRETEIQPRIAWDAADRERDLNILELDLRFVDNYRQAAFLTKSAAVSMVDSNLPATFTTGMRGIFHEEGEVIAVRHQTMEGISYTPFTIEAVALDGGSQGTRLKVNLYNSAIFDERIAKAEKFFESTLTPNPEPTNLPPPILTGGGFTTTNTGSGNGDGQSIRYETYRSDTLPFLQTYSPQGRDNL